MTLLIIMN